MYEIIFTKEAENQLKKLNQSVQERIGSALERIKVRPHNFTKRMYDEPYYRVRVDNYRMILDIQDTALLIYVIDLDTRGNIYKNLHSFT